jgi:hypothetical protein
MDTLEWYGPDCYAWALKKAERLRRGQLSEIDAANVAKELESMGKSDQRALLSRLEERLMHWLKWRYQSQQRISVTTGWPPSISKTHNNLGPLPLSPVHASPGERAFSYGFLDLDMALIKLYNQ